MSSKTWAQRLDSSTPYSMVFGAGETNSSSNGALDTVLTPTPPRLQTNAGNELHQLEAARMTASPKLRKTSICAFGATKASSFGGFLRNLSCRRSTLLYIVIMMAACTRGGDGTGLYVNDALKIELKVGDRYFVERAGDRELYGQWGTWSISHGSLLGSKSLVNIFKGIVLDPTKPQTNREQKADWSHGDEDLAIEVEPGKTITFHRKHR